MQVHADRAPRPEAVEMRLSGMMGEDAAAPPFLQASALVLAKAAGQDQAHIVVCVLVGRDFIVAAMRRERQKLAARGARRHHVIGHSELERVRLVPHAVTG